MLLLTVDFDTNALLSVGNDGIGFFLSLLVFLYECM